MPDLLFLTQRLPYPPIKGEKIRPLHILGYLKQWYDVHLGCLIDDPDDAQHIDTIRAMCSDLYVAPLDRRCARLTCLRGLLTGEAFSVAFFRHRGLARWVRRVIDQVQPAVVFVNSSNMAPYILDLPRTGLRIVDLADIDSEKWRAYADTACFPMRAVYRREWHRVAYLERRIALECDLSSFVSDAEADLFARQVPECADRIRGISSGVDHRYFDPDRSYPALYDPAPATYVFTGTMDYKPNVDAVTWFATDILPRIRYSLKQVQFYIVGNNPNAAVRGLARLDDVFVTGRVADVRPYIVHATASVAPMRIARGIQNKVLEAMSMGKPVVVTSGALEGIKAELACEVLLADTAEDFANVCCGLATGTDGLAIGRAARRRVLHDYDWSRKLRMYDDLLRPGQAPAVITGVTGA